MTQAPATESRKRITLLLDLDGCEAFVEQGTTGLSIDCGGSVITRSLKDWHAIAAAPHTAAPAADRAVSRIEDAYREGFRDAATFADVDTAWKLSVTTHLTAPPADRAELAAKVRVLAENYAEDMVRENYKTAGDTFDKLRAAIDALARSTDAPSEPRLPHPGSPLASAMMDSVLAEYHYPTNTKNAARAGFEAARRILATPPAAATPSFLADFGEWLDAVKMLHSADAATNERGRAIIEARKTAIGGTGYLPGAIAATQAPAAASSLKVQRALEAHHDDMAACTPTAGNTEDARSMGAVSEDRERQRFDEWKATWKPERHEAWDGWLARAALTQAASTGGAAS